MVNHMVNHDLARFTMIMARVPWLRTLGKEKPSRRSDALVDLEDMNVKKLS